MLFQRLKTPGLAHHSYLLELAPGQIAVVDPRRDIDVYLEIAMQADAQITHVLETHRQENFEYGSAALAARVCRRAGEKPAAAAEGPRSGRALQRRQPVGARGEHSRAPGMNMLGGMKAWRSLQLPIEP
jgi:glyoxylase-like metal-dependent hydrolase (beta-lactamase superfamily II)